MTDRLRLNDAGQPIPSEPFLAMTLIQLRKSEKETGMDFPAWLNTFAEAGDDLTKAVHEFMIKEYPPKNQPELPKPEDVED